MVSPSNSKQRLALLGVVTCVILITLPFFGGASGVTIGLALGSFILLPIFAIMAARDTSPNKDTSKQKPKSNPVIVIGGIWLIIALTLGWVAHQVLTSFSNFGR